MTDTNLIDINYIICPHCHKSIVLREKMFGEPSPKCPDCGEQILEWLDDYNVDFTVAGGTGAQREGRKRFGGRKPL